MSTVSVTDSATTFGCKYVTYRTKKRKLSSKRSTKLLRWTLRPFIFSKSTNGLYTRPGYGEVFRRPFRYGRRGLRLLGIVLGGYDQRNADDVNGLHQRDEP
jgi:hypothetical protein